MSIQDHEHKSIFYCAGGNCQITQCVYCITFVRSEEELKTIPEDRKWTANIRCIYCGMLYDLCSCDGKTRVESRLNNSG